MRFPLLSVLGCASTTLAVPGIGVAMVDKAPSNLPLSADEGTLGKFLAYSLTRLINLLT